MSEPAFRFRHDLRVRYVETDAQAIVYHSNYLVYCDAARVEWFRALRGGGKPWRDDSDWEIVLVHAALDFKSSARFDDELTVWMRVEHVGTTSFSFSYQIDRAGERLCEAKTVHVAVDRHARTKRPLPDSFKQRLVAFDASVGSRSD